MTVDMPYIEAELAQLDAGAAPPAYLRHLHWGLFDATDVDDDSPARYVAAAVAMTEQVVSAAQVADGVALLDVGCGFGGTLAHVRARNRGCRLVGLNIDHRQLWWARELAGKDAGRDAAAVSAPLPRAVAQHGDTEADGVDLVGAAGRGRVAGGVGWVTADGCWLPVASRSVDRVLAVECVFHFPSRKAFFTEAARVLRPDGMLALSDFVVDRGAMGRVAENVGALGVGGWYGWSSRPLTSAGYRRLAAAYGFEVITDEDVTARTLPTYAALRRIYREAAMPEAVTTLTGVESLARAGGWEYHVLAFRRRDDHDSHGRRG